MSTPQPSSVSPLLRALLNNRKFLRGAIFAVAALFLAVPLILMVREGGGFRFGLRWLYAGLMAVVAVVIGAIDTIGKEDDEESAVLRLRLELMALGGILGLGTALFGVGLWLTTYRADIAGGLEKWRANWGALVWPGLAVIGGLILMFVSVQLVRGLERQHQTIRRIIYGYNVVLTTLLLVAVLTLPNILAYAEPFARFFGRPYDWTQSDIHTISSKTRNYLASLKEPVNVYVLLPGDNPIAQDTKTFLENCRGLKSDFTWELISPLHEPVKARELMEKYNFVDSRGLLLVVGQEGEGKKPDYTFVKFSDLYEQDRTPGTQSLNYAFLGENAIYNALTELTEGKTVIYFTTGHGELSPDDGQDPPGMPPGMRRPQGGGGLSQLRTRLTDRKSVQVKTLAVDRSLKAVPDDATVVVVARPTQPFAPGEVKVLREYLSRQGKSEKTKDTAGNERTEEKVTPGKMIILCDPIVQKEGSGSTLVRTGLEGLLAEYQVQLGDDRIVTPLLRNPLLVIALAPPNAQNPVAKSFAPSPRSRIQFRFENVRSVEPIEAKGPGGKNVDKLLLVPATIGPVLQTNFNSDPNSLADALRGDEDKFDKMRSRRDVTIGVAVTEGGTPPGMPRDAAHAGALKETPRLVVIGSAGWVSDENLGGGEGALNYDLFNSCVSWLRERSTIGQTIEGKKRKEYVVGLPETEKGRLAYLPLGLLLLVVIGLGTGVWVVRRR